MPEDRFEKTVLGSVIYREFNLWRNAIVFSFVMFFIFSIYEYIYFGYYNIIIANKVAALTAITMIGCSFILSGVCYFWDFLDKKIIYRKYLGITGFSYGLVHGVFSLIMYFFSNDSSQTFNFYEIWNFLGFNVSNVIAFILGLIALLIFIFMTAISNKVAMKKFGKNWRKLLRIGYIAIIFVIIHFSIKKYSYWHSYITNFCFCDFKLPSLNFLVLLFSFLVIAMRVALFISLKLKKKSESN